MENMGWNKKIKITNEDVINFLISKKKSIKNVGKADKGFSYCNTNYALLALLIEKVSGKNYSDYLINVPSNDTPRIQESHIMVGHIICEMVENLYF